MSQSRTQSMVEAAANTATGFAVSWLLAYTVYPLFGFPVSVGQNTAIVTIFTVASIIRSYLWRRVFNHIHRGAAE